MHKRRIAYLLAGLFLMLVIFLFLHFWMLQHAETLIRRLVSTQTQGMYDLHIQQIHLDNNLHVIRLQQTTLKAYDRDGRNTRFILQIPYLYMKIRRIPALVLNRALYVDSIYCQSPTLHVGLHAFAVADSSMSLAEQMDVVYLQIQKLLTLLQIEKMNIKQGELIFTSNPDTLDREATRIQYMDLHIQHFKIDSTTVKKQQQQKFISNEVTFHLGAQTIFLNHQQQKISFTDFYLSTADSACRIRGLSFYAHSKDKPVSSYALSADELYFKKNEFNKLYFNKTFQSDSLIVQHARVTLQVNLNAHSTHKVKDTAQLLKAVLSRIADRASVHHVVIQDAVLKVNAGAASSRYVFQSGKQKLNLHEVVFDARSKNPFSIQQASLNMQDYSFQSSDSSWRFTLQQLMLHQDTLMLVKPDLYHQNRQRDNQFHLLASSIMIARLDLNRLIAEQNTGIREAFFNEPEIYIFRGTESMKEKQMLHLIPRKFLKSLHLLHDLRVLHLRQGTIHLHTPKDTLLANNINGTIGYPFVLGIHASSPTHLSVAQLRFQFNGNELKNDAGGYIQHLTIENQEMRSEELHIHTSNALFNCEQCYLILNKAFPDSASAMKNYKWMIAASGWKEAHIEWQKEDSMSAPYPAFPSFLIAKLSGEHTDVLLRPNREHASGDVLLVLDYIRLDSFYHDQHHWGIHNYRVLGKQGAITTSNLRLQFQEFNWCSDTTSYIHHLQISSLHDSSIKVFIPTITWKQQPDENLKNTSSLKLNQLHLDSARITIVQRTDAFPIFQMHQSIASHSLQIDSMEVQDANIQFLQYDSIHQEQPRIHIAFQGNGLFTNMHMENDPSSVRKLQFQHLYTDLHDFHIQQNHLNHLQQSNIDRIKFTLSRFEYATSSADWQVFMDSCRFHNLNIHHDTYQIDASGDLYRFTFSNTSAKSFITNTLSRSIHSRIVLHHFAFTNAKLIFQGWNMNYHSDRQLLSMDSVYIHPRKNREDFIKQLQTQKDYVQFSSAQWKLTHFQPLSWINQQTIVADTFELYRPEISVYRDKRLPLDVKLMKPMPSEVPNRLPFNLHIDRWNIHQGFASYTEISAQTGNPGTVWFNDINAEISPLISDSISRNIVHTKDSENNYLQITAAGRLMNQPLIHLNYIEDRSSPLHLFKLRVQSSPFAFSLFNPILESWFHATVISGNIAGAEMQAKGNIYMMIGNMNLRYDQLKISLDREKDSTGKKLYSGLENFLANLALRSQNFHRTGLIFYRRNPHLSFFNYWVKGVESGIGSSIMGNKWNRAYRHHYEKLIKEHPEFKQGL